MMTCANNNTTKIPTNKNAGRKWKDKLTKKGTKTKFEKLLDEYKETYSNKIYKAEYKILICSFVSNEIIEGVKSLTELNLFECARQDYCLVFLGLQAFHWKQY